MTTLSPPRVHNRRVRREGRVRDGVIVLPTPSDGMARWRISRVGAHGTEECLAVEDQLARFSVVRGAPGVTGRPGRARTNDCRSAWTSRIMVSGLSRTSRGRSTALDSGLRTLDRLQIRPAIWASDHVAAGKGDAVRDTSLVLWHKRPANHGHVLSLHSTPSQWHHSSARRQVPDGRSSSSNSPNAAGSPRRREPPHRRVARHSLR